jgi:proton-dependent oligopeptide transporter, POT family
MTANSFPLATSHSHPRGNFETVRRNPMSKTPYLTAPLKTDKMPPGVPYIVGNEAAERFSFYGMNSILATFMTKYMLDRAGQADHLSEATANEWYHTFIYCSYFISILGAVLADAFWGKYKTILYLSIVYCLGHFVLGVNETRYGLIAGLGLIALGAGGIKPCVSANVGDQFGSANQHLLPKAFSWFYFSINFGSAFSTILIPYLLEKFPKDFSLEQRWGTHIAFATPGFFMLLATVVFWLGRKRFVHIPPRGRDFFREIASRDALKALGNLGILVPFVAVFWALWYQNFSAWVLQAEKMDRFWLGREWQAGQIQTVNPIFILLFLPLFSYVVYPALNRAFRLTPLRKIGIGFLLTVLAFLVPAWIESQLAAGLKPHVGWQVLAYVFISAAEVIISVTYLEFSYTQAPPNLKSVVMSMYLVAIALGNLLTAQVNHFIQNPDGSTKLTGSHYYLFFAALMLGTTIIFAIVAPFYRGKTYIRDQGETQSA